MVNIEWLKKNVEEVINYKNEPNLKKKIINAKILYTKLKNISIEDNKNEAISFYQLALSKFEKSEMGATFKKKGWLDEYLSVDCLHNLIINSKTCNILDELDEEYDIDIVEHTAKVVEGPNSYILDIIEAYNWFCCIRTLEQEQIENSFKLIKNIVGCDWLKDIENFQTNLMAFGFYTGDPGESKNTYRGNWLDIKSKIEFLYKEQNIINKENFIYVINSIDTITNYYTNGPQMINTSLQDNALTLSNNHIKRACIL